MSINVYLKGDEVKKLEGFTTKPRRDRDREWNEYGLPGVDLWHHSGRWYTVLHEPTEAVPAVVADIVEEISLHEYLRNRREEGIYRCGSAEAEIDRQSAGGKPLYRVRIVAKKMEDLLELFRKIKIGSIRPEESYEGQQSGMSRADLEAELERMRHTNSIVCSVLGSLRGNLDAFREELKGRWPFCAKRKVLQFISRVLDNHRV